MQYELITQVIMILAFAPSILVKNIILTIISEYSWLVTFVIILVLMVLCTVLGLLWFRQRSKFYKKQLEVEVERTRILEELKKSEKNFRELFDDAPIGYHELDSEGKIVLVNHTELEMLGYTEEEMLGKYIWNIVGERELSHQAVLAKLSGKMDVPLKGYERTFRRKDGSIINVLVEDRLLRNANNEIIGIRTTIQDITIRKRMEQALAQEQYLLQTLMRNLPEQIYFKDLNSRYIRVSKSLADKFKLNDPKEMIGKTDYDFYPYENARAAYECEQKIIRTGKPITGIEEKEIGNNNAEHWVITTKMPLRDEKGNIIGTFGISTDITKIKKTEAELKKAKEEAEESLKAKSDFLALISHEIHTPLNGVIGMSDLLARTELTHEQAEYVETIKTSGVTLLTIVNDILDFTNIESGRIELERKPFELAVCIEEVFGMVSSKAIEKNLDLLYRIDPGIPKFIMGDKFRLKQILYNIVSNAIKYTEKGEVYIYIGLNRKNGKSIELLFTIKDTGIGIPACKINRLFKPFKHAYSSSTGMSGGVGLGLAVSSHLVELMDGRIWAESIEGKGSTFIFTIKFALPQTELNIPKNYTTEKEFDIINKRVLIVDDNITNLQIMKELCQLWKLYPRITNSPIEALKWIERGDYFDIAIIDLLMPDMDGVQLAKEIRKCCSEHQLPLILFSSLAAGLDNSNIPNGLFYKQISKPIRQSQLYNAIVETLLGAKVMILKNTTSGKEDTNMQNGNLKILIAEDSLVNQKILLKMLNQIGLSADVVSNGLEAIEAINTIRYDLVFMDVNMPQMDGLEATRKILSGRNLVDRPKIIALTADAMSGDKEKCIEAGMDDYITKPVRFEDVINVIKCWLPYAVLQEPPYVNNKKVINVGQSIVYPIANAG